MAGLKRYQLAVFLLLACNALASTHEVSASGTGVATHTSTLGAVESTAESGTVGSTAERTLQAKKPKCPGNLTLFQTTKTVTEKVKKGKKFIYVKKTIVTGYYCACKPGFKRFGNLCVKIPPQPKPSPKFG